MTFKKNTVMTIQVKEKSGFTRLKRIRIASDVKIRIMLSVLAKRYQEFHIFKWSIQVPAES